MNSIAARDGRPSIVLDTNVVLDWLLFADGGVAGVAAALESGHLQWLACLRMRDEFKGTLLRPELARWRPDSERLLAMFDTYAVMLDPPASVSTLLCDDVDDQLFIDLAVQSKASWLVSHDRAVLRLRRRAAALGLQIVKPARWTPA